MINIQKKILRYYFEKAIQQKINFKSIGINIFIYYFNFCFCFVQTANMSDIKSLTVNGLPLIVKNKDMENIVLQVVGFSGQSKKVENQQIFISFISDGKYKMKCFWSEDKTAKIKSCYNQFQNQIVKIKKYGASQKSVLVYDYQIVHLSYPKMIGNPIVLLQQHLKILSNQVFPIQTPKIKKQQQIQMKKQTATKSNPPIKIQKSQVPTIKKRIEIKNSNQFQQISDLYPSLQNWRIFCRVIKKNYNQFLNKKGTLTKLLSLQLIDRKQTIIKASIFGDFGQRMNSQLTVDQMYIFSDGLVKVDTYKTKNIPNMSDYTINFTQHSKIALTTDDKSVKTIKTGNIFSKIAELKDKSANQQVDVVGIIKQIKDQITIPSKSNRDITNLKKRSIVLCDPITKLELDVIFWNNMTNIDVSLLNKTVLLSNFKIHQYNSAKSLNASFKSQMTELPDHEFVKFQKNAQNIQYESLSYRRGDGETKTPKTIKQIQQQKQRLTQNAQLWSDLRVYLNKIKQKKDLKKWYISCPFCKKTVGQSQTSCFQCKKNFQKPKARYILQIQLSDTTGSIWTTAYDEFAQKIFKVVGNYSADVARTMTEPQFYEMTKKCVFQEYKMKMITKYDITPDGTRRIKHNIAKLLPLDYATEAKNNLQKIKLML